MTPKEIMQKWIDALRSGSYTQTMGCLRNGDCFCAIGVLCDIYAKEGIGEWIGDRFNTKDSDKPPMEGYLPRKIGDELAEYESTIRGIISMNDSEKMSFSEIADAIAYDVKEFHDESSV